MIRAEQPSFAGGEIAPELAARIDTAKYQTALRLGRNVIGLRQGGVRSRPGTLLIGQVRNNGRKVRLIPFQFSAAQAYCLEFGHLIFRVIVHDPDTGARGYVTEAAKVISGRPAANPLRFTIANHGFTAGQQFQVEGVVGMVDLDADGLSGVNGRTFRVESAPDADTIVVQALGQTSGGVDASGWTGYVSGGTAARLFELATPYRIDNDVPVDDLPDLRFEQSADVMYLAHPSHPLKRLSRTGHAAWTLETVSFGTLVNPPTGAGATAGGPGGGAPASHTYRVTAYDDVSGQESLVSGAASASSDLTIAGNHIDVTWTAPAAGTTPTRYFIYKSSNGLFGFIGAVETHTPPMSFRDDNIDADLGDTPPIDHDPLGASGSYPGALGFFEQRLFLGGPDSKPNGVWGTRSGDFENLNFSRPVKADDSVAFGISARQVNRVLHLVPMSDLLAFTSDSVFRVNGGGVTDYITPTSIVVRPQVHRGASRARPVVIDDAVLYVTAKGSRVRNLGYQLQADGYQGTDLTVFAAHFFQGRTIEEMAWCEHPHSAVFCRTSDGKLLCLTWMLEQEVWGWTLLETDGEVESVCAVTEDGRDSIYIAVRRMTGLGQKRFVERLADPFETGDDISGCVCLDSAVTHAGEVPYDLFAGLEHLEGRAVKALADGHVVSGLTVAAGRVTLPFEASRVAVGLPYSAVIKTLTPVNPQAATQGRKLGVSRATLRLLDSRGLKAGVLMDRLEPIKPRLDAGWGEPADLLSGDHAISFDTDYAPDAGVIVRQDEPLPMTVLGVYIEAGAGG